MILSILNLNSSAERRTEVFQTLASLSQLIRRETGCRRCEFCQESGDDTAFAIIEEWESRKAFDRHLRSQVFGIMLGLGPLLRRPMEVSICTVASREGMEAVRRVRAGPGSN